jgi:hypothetical protein
VVSCPETPPCRVIFQRTDWPLWACAPHRDRPCTTGAASPFRVLPDPAPMQKLASPLGVCEARIREL